MPSSPIDQRVQTTLKCMPTQVPQLLYKYRHFNALTMELLVTDQLYFGDPASFNDPLDTKPVLHTDLPLIAMENLLRTMVSNRVEAEMKAAAKAIKYQGQKTADHIQLHSNKQANSLISDIAYSPYNEDSEMPTEAMRLRMVAGHIQQELLRQYDKGVLCLAESCRSSLMWSHYGDQHHGLCLGYEVPAGVGPVHKVDYERGRQVRASLVAEMLNGDPNAKNKVDSIVLATKAGSWNYEKEWRLLGARGMQPSVLELKEITFGLRCPRVVQHCVIQALRRWDTHIDYFYMSSPHDDYNLVRYSVDLDELDQSYPRQSPAKIFKAYPHNSQGPENNGVLE